MAGQVELQNDASESISSYNFGSVEGGNNNQFKFRAINIGDRDVNSVTVEAQRLAANDGVDFVSVAPDSGGSPGSYTTGQLSVGTLVSLAEYWFWVKVAVPSGATPEGNPRQFNVKCRFKGS